MPHQIRQPIHGARLITQSQRLKANINGKDAVRATITDSNTANCGSASLTVTLTAGATGEDRLEIRNTGAGPGEIRVSGNNVSYAGAAIGTFSGGVGTTPLAVTFNSAATPVAAEALLRSITFRNTNANPPPSRRAVTFTLVHADTASASETWGQHLQWRRPGRLPPRFSFQE